MAENTKRKEGHGNGKGIFVMTSCSHKAIHYALLVLIIVLYPFSLKLSNAAIIALGIHWLIWFLRIPQRFNWREPMMWLLISSYLLTALSLLYSANLKVAIFALDKKISMLIFPLVIGTAPALSRKHFTGLLFAANAAVSVALLVCVIAAAYRFPSIGATSFFWSDFTDILGEFHPTYLSLYINFLIAWLAIYLFKNRGTEPFVNKCYIVATIIFFYISLVLLSSKIQLILGGIIPFVLAVAYMNKRQLKLFIPAFFAILVVATVTLTRTKAWERFKHINTFEYKLSAPVSTFNEFTIRLALAECSWHIIKDNPVFGVGVGDVYDELEKVYRKVDYKFGYLDQQNPHNEYLSQWLATGILGVVIMVMILSLMLLKAIQKKQYDLLILLMLFIITFAIESMLERQKGIVLYSLFISLYCCPENKVSHSRGNQLP
jgi:O-antigen ligase